MLQQACPTANYSSRRATPCGCSDPEWWCHCTLHCVYAVTGPACGTVCVVSYGYVCGRFPAACWGTRIILLFLLLFSSYYIPVAAAAPAPPAHSAVINRSAGSALVRMMKTSLMGLGRTRRRTSLKSLMGVSDSSSGEEGCMHVLACSRALIFPAAVWDWSHGW